MLTEGAASVFSPRAEPGDPERLEGVLGPKSRFVLFVGGISPHKRVGELVRAFGIVAAEPANEDLRLVLAGPGDRDSFAADRSGVAEAIASLGPHSARVVQTGFVADETLAALYRASECVVLPSLMEGFGLPALEAMASGAPLIVARNAALQEVCGEAAAEYVQDIRALPAILRRVLGDATRRAELSRAGLERARQFGWDEAARRLLAAFDRRNA